MAAVVLRGDDDRRIREEPPVLQRQLAPSRGPAGDIGQPRAQHGGLHLVEPRVHAELLMMVAVRLSAVAQPLDAVGERAVVRHHGAAIAERGEVLRRVEAERPGGPDGADRSSGARGEVRLTAVLDDRQRMRRGDAFDGGHVGWLAIQMDWHDGPRARRDRGLDRLRIDRQTRRVDVGKHRLRAGHDDGEGGIGRG